MSLSPGTRLGSYEVTALIGQGGMGEVYRARATDSQRFFRWQPLFALRSHLTQGGSRGNCH